MNGNNDQWNEAQALRLAALWTQKNADGRFAHSAAGIGFALGVSKNAVVGKAHRLGLEPRPTPIRAQRAQKAPRPTRAPRFTIIEGGSVEREKGNVVELLRGNCRWPLGDPGAKGFRYCEAPAILGKPYCSAHCRLAYARHVPDDPPEAA